MELLLVKYHLANPHVHRLVLTILQLCLKEPLLVLVESIYWALDDVGQRNHAWVPLSFFINLTKQSVGAV